MNNTYKSINHSKYLLQFHVIFVSKFRYPFFKNNKINILIKQILIDTANKNSSIIHFIESDTDHIHFLIKTVPSINLSRLIGKLAPNEMSKYYWNNKHFCWTRGYFISSIGNVSNDTIRTYILNQGKEELASEDTCNARCKR